MTKTKKKTARLIAPNIFAKCRSCDAVGSSDWLLTFNVCNEKCEKAQKPGPGSRGF